MMASYRRELGDGLVARWSTARDLDQIAQLYGHVFRHNPDDPPAQSMIAWTQDLGSGKHPSADSTSFAVVEDTRSHMIVSALVVLQQTWRYAGIPFTIGRPEAVASHPEYRNRGMVRAIFEMLHARSAERGDMAQGITGISYFYRQFGYEYAVDIEGWRQVPFSGIPERSKELASEPYRLRVGTVDDLPLLRELYERECQNPLGEARLVTTTFDESYWRWMLAGQNPASGEGFTALIIEDQAGEPHGYAMGARLRRGPIYTLFAFSTRADTSLVNMMPSVLRALKQHAEQTPARGSAHSPASSLRFMLGAAHPAYDALPPDSVGRRRDPYAWYVRVPDLPRFIRHVAPALEQQLANSPAAGYSGAINIDFYRDGLRLVFEHGRLTTAEPWRAIPWGPDAQASFPPLVFLQLLFGRRSLQDLQYAFPDVGADDEAAIVLSSLFPKRPSWAFWQD